MLSILKVTTYVAAGIAVLILLSGFGAATGAPQEAVVAALAVAVIVIPYAVTATAQRSRLIRLAERRLEAEGTSAADTFSADNLRQSLRRE